RSVESLLLRRSGRRPTTECARARQLGALDRPKGLGRRWAWRQRSPGQPLAVPLEDLRRFVVRTSAGIGVVAEEAPWPCRGERPERVVEGAPLLQGYNRPDDVGELGVARVEVPISGQPVHCGGVD